MFLVKPVRSGPDDTNFEFIKCVSKEDLIGEEEPSWVDPESEPATRRITGFMKIPSLLVDPQIEKLKFVGENETFSKNLSMEIQSIFDKNESRKKLMEKLSKNFDKKINMEQENEQLKSEIAQLKSELCQLKQMKFEKA